MSDTTMSLNEQVMRALHPTWVKMGGYFNDCEGRGYVTPDFEHSADASLEVLRSEVVVVELNLALRAARITDYTKPIGEPPRTYSAGYDEPCETAETALARALLAWARKEAGR